jgi:hypothetical protein
MEQLAAERRLAEDREAALKLEREETAARNAAHVYVKNLQEEEIPGAILKEYRYIDVEYRHPITARLVHAIMRELGFSVTEIEVVPVRVTNNDYDFTMEDHREWRFRISW